MPARKKSIRKSQTPRRRALKFEALESRDLLAVTTLAPVADTHIEPSPVGSSSVLDAVDFVGGGDRVSYVRFDLSGVDIDDLNNATLTLHKVTGTRNDTLNVDRFIVHGLVSAAGNTPQDWSESTLSSATVGAEYTNVGGDGIDLTRVFNLQGAGITEIANNTTGVASISGPDLVAFLESRIADDGLVTFVVYADADTGTELRGFAFGSREGRSVVAPSLTLDFEGEGPPDPYPEEPVRFTRQVEYLNRGIVAIRQTSQIYVGWRMLGTDPADVAFNLYRSTGGGPAILLNGTPLTATTDFVDVTANLTLSNEYFVRPVVGGIEQGSSESFLVPAFAPVQQYLNVPLQVPANGTTPLGQSYSYSAGDVSVGDVDGDGEYELIVKWDPSNQQDNSNGGYTGNVYVDAYKLDGARLWRIDLGVNIRAGAHYTQLGVYDFDGDGKAEVALKTAPGTIDGQGVPVLLGGHVVTADYRNGDGYILTGPEYLTIFNGLTGANMATIPFEPARGSVSQWGDGYGNRVDRFNVGVAYLDGVRPSLIIGRGYYGPGDTNQARNEVAAYDFRDGQLTLHWHFRAGYNINGNINVTYIGQGNHNLSVADVDGDGYDEIIYGASAIDHDGTGLYSTGLGHGDALHVSDMDPTNPGLEVFQPHEDAGSYGGAGGEFRDAMTGQLLFGIPSTNDVGRGVAFDIDPNHLGYEMWATTNVGTRSVYNSQGQAIYPTANSGGGGSLSFNFGVWWDADPLRELLDGTTISKWQYNDTNPGQPGIQRGAVTLLSPSGVSSINGTKATPNLSADLFGDWREEVIFRTNNSTALQIWTTTIPSTMRLYTLMHDTQYREAIAWQNSAYNQPPHPSFFLGAGMTTPPQPNIYIAAPDPIPGDFDLDRDVDDDDLVIWEQTYGTTPGAGFFGDADGDNDADGSDFLLWQQYYGTAPLAAVQATAAISVAPPSASLIAPLDSALASIATAGLPGSNLQEPTLSAIGEQPALSVEESEIIALPSIAPAATREDSGSTASASKTDDDADGKALGEAFAGWDLLDRYKL